VIEQRFTDGKKERFLKAWNIVKINREGHAQNRIFLLSDRRFHTLKYSKKNKNFPEKRMKSYNISDVEFMDVARYKASKTDVKLIQPYGIAFYLKNSSNNVSEEDDDQPNQKTKSTDSPKESQTVRGRTRGRTVMDNKATRRTTSFDISSFEKKEENVQDAKPELSTPSKKPNWAVKKAKKVLKKLQKTSSTAEMDLDGQVRPLVKKYVSHVFGPPETIHQSSDQKDYLDEIAWCMFAVMGAQRRAHPLKPFYAYPIKKPKMLSLRTLKNVVAMM
jgi:hypothetical protein